MFSCRSDPRFLKGLCFQAVFVRRFITNILGFDSDEKWEKLSFAQTVSKQDSSLAGH